MAGAKKAPCVDLKTDALKDERFEVLGELAGYNRFEAIGRMFALWSWCIDRGLKDAPDDSDGYVVAEAIVRRFLGDAGVTAILADDCDELALGVRRDDGRIYLRGTSEYVTARRQRVGSASAGGKARAAAPRDAAGHFVVEHTIVQPESSRNPAGEPAGDQRAPASSSSSSSSSSPSSSEDQDRSLPRARAIPPSRELVPQHGRDDMKRRLKGFAWQYAGQRYTELGLEGIDPTAPNCWSGMPSAGSPPMQELDARVDELLDQVQTEDAAREAIKRRVDVAATEGRHKNRRDFMIPLRMWNRDSFWIGASMSPGQIGRESSRVGPRSAGSGAIGSAPPSTGHGVFAEPFGAGLRKEP